MLLRVLVGVIHVWDIRGLSGAPLLRIEVVVEEYEFVRVNGYAELRRV